MDDKKYILDIEGKIALLRNEIQNINGRGLVQSGVIPYIKTNISQLPFDIENLDINSSLFEVKDFLLDEYHKAKNRKIIPMPGIEATFCYDFLTNVSTWCGPMQLIYGWDDRYDASFEEVLEFIAVKDQQRFEDIAFGMVGKKSHVITKPLLLCNGHTIIEEYNFLYHGGDYERKSPILLQGKTTLVKTHR